MIILAVFEGTRQRTRITLSELVSKVQQDQDQDHLKLVSVYLVETTTKT